MKILLKLVKFNADYNNSELKFKVKGTEGMLYIMLVYLSSLEGR